VLSLLGAAAQGYRLWRRQQNRLKPVAAATRPLPHLRMGPSPQMPQAILRAEVPEVSVSEVARHLRIVWSLRVAPDGRLFIAERGGRVLVLQPHAAEPEVYAQLATALAGESGLMGLALDPDFPRRKFVYVMYTARKPGGGVNRISRFTDTPQGARDELVLIDDIPAARNHDGGALEFGPDGMLYIGTGDANVPALAQDPASLNGKILRITPNGAVPSDNPLPASPVWAAGFRNVTGLAFHPATGDLWAASHGPSGVSPEEPKHMDSVYLVKKGGNHGWPLHLGVSEDGTFVSPTVFYPERAVPPGGLTFYGDGSPDFRDNLFMTSLRGQEIHRFVIDGRRLTRLERWWTNRFGRLRALTVAPDGSLYAGTSNRDGRAEGEYPDSDFVYRLTPTRRDNATVRTNVGGS
jgi:quinoprotein glucose dehydrogenase